LGALTTDQGYLYKIGMTGRGLKRRFKDFQGLPFKISLHLAFYLDKIAILESYLHELLSSKKISGEWFKLDHNDFITIFEKCTFYKEKIKKIECFSNPPLPIYLPELARQLNLTLIEKDLVQAPQLDKENVPDAHTASLFLDQHDQESL
jgi:hypothetical protein